MIDPQLIAYLEGFLTPKRRELFDKVIDLRTNHITVAIEDVYQLHNTSAVMRSCDVFGIQNLHVIEERNKKKIDREIAMGAQKWISLNRYTNTSSCINRLKSEGYQIVATSPHGDSVGLQDFDIRKKSAIFFGAEKQGISQEVVSQADVCLKIPMYGFSESLNISVSAAIILQVLTENLRKGKINWQLSEIAKNEVKFEWLENSLKNLDLLIQKFSNA